MGGGWEKFTTPEARSAEQRRRWQAHLERKAQQGSKPAAAGAAVVQEGKVKAARKRCPYCRNLYTHLGKHTPTCARQQAERMAAQVPAAVPGGSPIKSRQHQELEALALMIISDYVSGAASEKAVSAAVLKPYAELAVVALKVKEDSAT